MLLLLLWLLMFGGVVVYLKYGYCWLLLLMTIAVVVAVTSGGWWWLLWLCWEYRQGIQGCVYVWELGGRHKWLVERFNKPVLLHIIWWSVCKCVCGCVKLGWCLTCNSVNNVWLLMSSVFCKYTRSSQNNICALRTSSHLPLGTITKTNALAATRVWKKPIGKQSIELNNRQNADKRNATAGNHATKSSGRLKPPLRFMYWRYLRFRMTCTSPTSLPSTFLFFVESKPQKPIAFIISCSSGDLPARSASDTTGREAAAAAADALERLDDDDGAARSKDIDRDLDAQMEWGCYYLIWWIRIVLNITILH